MNKRDVVIKLCICVNKWTNIDSFHGHGVVLVTNLVIGCVAVSVMALSMLLSFKNDKHITTRFNIMAILTPWI